MKHSGQTSGVQSDRMTHTARHALHRIAAMWFGFPLLLDRVEVVGDAFRVHDHVVSEVVHLAGVDWFMAHRAADHFIHVTSPCVGKPTRIATAGRQDAAEETTTTELVDRALLSVTTRVGLWVSIRAGPPLCKKKHTILAQVSPLR